MEFQKPIVFFDLETTGTDTSTDRIVSFAAVVILGGIRVNTANLLINPGMIIPEGATAVHGITNEMVKDAPTFKEVAIQIRDLMAGCDLAGFNILSFDVPMLAEHLLREKISFPEPGCNIYDAYKIFAHYEARTLTGAAKFYLNKTHDGAHDALQDVLMTQDVFYAQLQKYPQLQEMSNAELTRFCMGEGAVDFAGKLATNKDGVVCFNFGKSKGVPVVNDKGYARWMLDNSFPENTKAIIRQLLGIK